MPADIEEKVSTTVIYGARFHRNWFLALGIISLLLGIAAIAFPLIAALAVELLIGWILVISGISGFIHALRTSRWRGFHLSLLSSLVAFLIGLLLVLLPRSGILSLALLAALFFMVNGILRTVLAIRLRPLDQWPWLLLSGILSILMSLLVLLLWPEAAGWVIGILLGIDLIFSGATLILMALVPQTPQFSCVESPFTLLIKSMMLALIFPCCSCSDFTTLTLTGESFT